MTTSDWIQLGILITYTLTLLGGGLIALLRLNRIITDIEDRQKRIDIAGEQWRQLANDTEKRMSEQNGRNNFIMISLIMLNFLMWFLMQQDRKK